MCEAFLSLQITQMRLEGSQGGDPSHPPPLKAEAPNHAPDVQCSCSLSWQHQPASAAA